MFITALVLFFGPKILPEHVQPTPAEWAPVVIAAMAFSGALLLFWLASAIWHNGHQLIAHFWKRIRQQPLNKQELRIVQWLARSPTIATDVEQLGYDYDNQPYTQLELMVLLNGLVDRGLVEYVALNNLVILTPQGCRFALELQCRERANVAASLASSDTGATPKPNTPPNNSFKPTPDGAAQFRR